MDYQGIISVIVLGAGIYLVFQKQPTVLLLPGRRVSMPRPMNILLGFLCIALGLVVLSKALALR